VRVTSVRIPLVWRNLFPNILERNNRWDAVLLLDEADVFLEARSAHDLERYKLVSIFLRLLEYYEGILFLTTSTLLSSQESTCLYSMKNLMRHPGTTFGRHS